MTKYSIKFYLDRRHEDAFGMRKLLCRVRLGRVDVLMYSMGHKVFTADWDADKQRCKEGSIEANVVNTEILKFSLKVREAYNRCVLGDCLDPASFKQLIDGNRPAGMPADDLLACFDKFTSLQKRLSKSTLNVYAGARKILQEFLESPGGIKHANKPVSNVQFAIGKVVYDFMLGKQLQTSTINAYYSKLTAYGEWLQENGITVHAQLFRKPKHMAQAAIKPYKITYEDWVKFRDYQPAANRNHRKDVHLMALLQAYTGLSFSDAMSLLWADIQQAGAMRIIVQHRRKNHREGRKVGRATVVPLLSPAERVLSQLKALNPDQFVVLPRLSDDTVRRALKLICQDIGITSLTTHDLRKVFANFICKRAGLHTSAISASLGHSSSSTTSKYYFKDDIGQMIAEFSKAEEYLKTEAM